MKYIKFVFVILCSSLAKAQPQKNPYCNSIAHLASDTSIEGGFIVVPIRSATGDSHLGIIQNIALYRELKARLRLSYIDYINIIAALCAEPAHIPVDIPRNSYTAVIKKDRLYRRYADMDSITFLRSVAIVNLEDKYFGYTSDALDVIAAGFRFGIFFHFKEGRLQILR